MTARRIVQLTGYAIGAFALLATVVLAVACG